MCLLFGLLAILSPPCLAQSKLLHCATKGVYGCIVFCVCHVQVGTIAQQHESDVADLVAELLPLGQDHLQNCTATTSSRSSSSSGIHSVSTNSSNNNSSRSTQHHHQQQQQQHPQQQQQEVPAEIQPWLSQSAVMEQLLSYSLAIAAAVPSVEMARREFAWRNGFFLGLPQGHTPRHCEWLARAGCADLLKNAGVS
jgi:hypothetical protein